MVVDSVNTKLPRNQAIAIWLMVIVTVIGFGLRLEHMLAFDGPLRGADYAVNVHGARWMLEHHRPFDFTHQMSVQVRYQPPLWYALGAVIIGLTGEERPIAILALLGWVVRQWLLWRLLQQAIPGRRWSMLVALAINALLPLSVLTDGKVNPEGFHSTLFMVALYALWRIEREATTAEGISDRTAAWFGVWSGVAVLTKATAGVLPMVAAAVFGAQAWRDRRRFGLGSLPRRVFRPALVAGALWCAVAGWWCGQNLVKHGHPFPHVWNLDPQPAEPVLYRRPLGWALPFEWREYVASPVIYNHIEPRPNFWAATITGTWTDFYNRGFCRLKGGGMSTRAWGANWGGKYGGPAWYVSLHCITLFQALLAVGLVITVVALPCLWIMLRRSARTHGERGTVALPIASALVVFFVMLFALTFPYDDNAVLNPRYLLPIATPMAACWAITLAEARNWKRALHIVSLSAIALIGVLLIIERFGG